MHMYGSVLFTFLSLSFIGDGQKWLIPAPLKSPHGSQEFHSGMLDNIPMMSSHQPFQPVGLPHYTPGLTGNHVLSVTSFNREQVFKFISL